VLGRGVDGDLLCLLLSPLVLGKGYGKDAVLEGCLDFTFFDIGTCLSNPQRLPAHFPRKRRSLFLFQRMLKIVSQDQHRFG